jgi:hypothetical protein
MADLSLRFEFEPGIDLNVAARVIQDRLAPLDIVAAVDARPEDARITGLEVVGAIAVCVQIVRGTRQLVAEVRRLIPELKGLRGDVAGLRTITLDSGLKPIAIELATNDDIAQAIDDGDGGAH